MNGATCFHGRLSVTGSQLALLMSVELICFLCDHPLESLRSFLCFTPSRSFPIHNCTRSPTLAFSAPPRTLAWFPDVLSHSLRPLLSSNTVVESPPEIQTDILIAFYPFLSCFRSAEPVFMIPLLSITPSFSSSIFLFVKMIPHYYFTPPYNLFFLFSF